MSDILLELGKNPQARNLIKGLGLPIPMPQPLRRPKGPMVERPLADRDVALCVSDNKKMVAALAEVLTEAGANPHIFEGDAAMEAFVRPGEAFGRPPAAIDLTDSRRFDALVMDGTAITSPAALRALYDFFHPLLGRLNRNARVVVLGQPAESQKDPATAAAQGALDGFVRSLGKELGKKGSTANLLLVQKGGEAGLAGPLRYLLSHRSGYISGQPLTVSGAATGAWVCPLEGKVALVTGAARGIGAATARLLAEEGATVVCLDRPQDDGPTSKLARELHGGVLLVDVTDKDAPQKIAAALKAEYGGVDIVVHNAGITRDKTLAKMKELWWDQTIDVNLGAVGRITEALVDEKVLKKGGRIICLSSIAGIAGNVGQTNYAASKSGIIGYVGALAKKLKKQQVTVNAIAPGFIETRLTAAIPFAIREAARRMNSLGQGGLPQDIGNAIVFLATPGAQGVTGQVLRVCGGALVGR